MKKNSMAWQPEGRDTIRKQDQQGRDNSSEHMVNIILLTFSQ